jgi:hypothetical protein
MRRWVLLAYRLPREPSTPRITLWRNLRRLGAAQVGDGLVILPLTDETREQLEWLASAVDDAGGESSVWLAEAPTQAQEARWVDRIKAASIEEYAALEQRAREAAEDSDDGRRRSLRLLRGELQRVRGRDYCHVAEGERTTAAIEGLATTNEEVVP